MTLRSEKHEKKELVSKDLLLLKMNKHLNAWINLDPCGTPHMCTYYFFLFIIFLCQHNAQINLVYRMKIYFKSLLIKKTPNGLFVGLFVVSKGYKTHISRV